MSRLKALIYKYPILSTILAGLLLIGVSLIIAGKMGPLSQTTGHQKSSLVSPYCIPDSCQHVYTFGPWRTAHKLVFANSKGIIDYEFPITRCRKVWQVNNIVVRHYFKREGHFKRYVEILETVRQNPDDECQIKGSSSLVDAYPLLGASSFNNNTPYQPYSAYSVYDGGTDGGPSKYEIR